ncbi:sulfotransferase domain-containing protein [Pseudanabaenaceae cyanobacterium LEGE 13415]|nr:sulfotransferase domain-containing protein [Pseudanabaenaceae cyanobacterium LEGE 13415]
MNTLDFVCVGPQRTGTSWLDKLLRYHPELCLPKNVKETMFFDRDYEKGIEYYWDYFSDRQSNQRCGEIGPTYFDSSIIPNRIQAINPNCKIIINLRNPISRALSSYHHHLGKGRVKGTFTDAIAQIPRIIDAGRYQLHTTRWLETFGADQVSFLLLEDIEFEPERVLSQLYEFLDVSTIEMPDLGKKRIGEATSPKYPLLAKVAAQSATWLRSNRLHHVAELGKALGVTKVYRGGERSLPDLTIDERYQLIEHYESDIAFLEKLLGRDLSPWRQA